MATAVLDSSVVLAALNGEPGADLAARLLPSALLSAVNLGEVVSKLDKRGLANLVVREMISLLDCEIVPFDVPQAMRAGLLYSATAKKGLSFGDRACLSLAIERGLPVYTADHPWAKLDLPVDIRLIR